MTAYLEVKILSLAKHQNLTTGKKNTVEKRRNCSSGAISPFYNIFNRSLNSRVQLRINLLNVVVGIIFPHFCKSDVTTDISKYFKESLGVRDNETVTRINCPYN